MELVQDISQLVEPVAFLGRLGGRVRQGATPMMGEKGCLVGCLGVSLGIQSGDD